MRKRTLEARLDQLEQQTDGAPERPRPVVLHCYAHDGTPLSTPPVPDGALLIRRQIVEAENGAPAPGYVPLRVQFVDSDGNGRPAPGYVPLGRDE